MTDPSRATHNYHCGVMGTTGVFRCCEDLPTFVHINWDESPDGTAGWPKAALMSPLQAFAAIAAHLTDHDQSTKTTDWLKAEAFLMTWQNVQQGVAALHQHLPGMSIASRGGGDGVEQPN